MRRKPTAKPLTVMERYSMLAIYGPTWPQMHDRAMLTALAIIRAGTTKKAGN